MPSSREIVRKTGKKGQHPSALVTNVHAMDFETFISVDFSAQHNLEHLLSAETNAFRSFLEGKGVPHEDEFVYSSEGAKICLLKEAKDIHQQGTTDLQNSGFQLHHALVKAKHDHIAGARHAALGLFEIWLFRQARKERRHLDAHVHLLRMNYYSKATLFAGMEPQYLAGVSRSGGGSEETDELKRNYRQIWYLYLEKNSKRTAATLLSELLEKQGVKRSPETIRQWYQD